MRVFVNPDLCDGCEECVIACPTVFRMGVDVAFVNAKEVPWEQEDVCRKAAENCPVEAITLEVWRTARPVGTC